VVSCFCAYLSLAACCLQVRHAGYTSLQSTLWQRSLARAAARGAAEGRAQLSSGLMESLDAVRGRLAPGWVPGAWCSCCGSDRWCMVLPLYALRVALGCESCHVGGLCMSMM
jgi:hypothetical protein